LAKITLQLTVTQAALQTVTLVHRCSAGKCILIGFTEHEEEEEEEV